MKQVLYIDAAREGYGIDQIRNTMTVCELQDTGGRGMSIGDRIKQARESAGLTQQQLSDAVSAGGGRQQVYNWEAGLRTPRRETLERIAEVLGVKAGWLMFGA